LNKDLEFYIVEVICENFLPFLCRSLPFLTFLPLCPILCRFYLFCAIFAFFLPFLLFCHFCALFAFFVVFKKGNSLDGLAEKISKKKYLGLFRSL